MPTTPYRISIAHADRAADAEVLRGALADRCRLMTNGATVLEFSTIPRVASDDDPPAALIVLGSAAASTDSHVLEQIRRAERQLIPTLPVYRPPGRGATTDDQLPPVLHQLHGFGWEVGQPTGALVDLVLRLVGLCESDRRVFLSYRRKDGQALADGLREKLIDSGWDVFLDRFSIQPAENFHRRLEVELADKAFVLLLETPDAKNSSWAEREITFALTHPMALMTLAVPALPVEDRFHVVPPDQRLELAESELVTAPGSTQVELTPAGLERVVTELELRHGAALRRRRETALLSAKHVLQDLGYETSKLSTWVLLGRREAATEVVLVTSRAAAPADLRRVDQERHLLRAPGARGWVVHPTEDMDEERVELLKWMIRRRRLDTSPALLFRDRVGR